MPPLCVSAQAIGVYLGALKVPESKASSGAPDGSQPADSFDEALDESDPDFQAFIQKLGGALEQ